MSFSGNVHDQPSTLVTFCMCHCCFSIRFGQVNVTCIASFPKPKSWVMWFLSIPFSMLQQWVLLLAEKDRNSPQTTCRSLRNWDRERWRNRERGAPVQRNSPIPHARQMSWRYCKVGQGVIRKCSESYGTRDGQLSRVCSSKNKQEVHLCLVIKNPRTRRQIWGRDRTQAKIKEKYYWKYWVG